MGTLKRLSYSLLVAAVYGLGTLGFTFILMARTPLPELAGDLLMLAIPAAAVIPLVNAQWFLAPCLFAGIPVQYLILYFCAEYIAHRQAISLAGLSGLQYLFIAVVWPVFFTLEQFLTLCIARKVRNRNKPKAADG